MSNEQAKQLLQGKSATLRKRIEAIEKDLQQEHSQDFAEQAVERENDDVLHNLLSESRQSLKRVHTALQRIEADEYTICSRCGDYIDARRLQAIPETDRCIRCA